MGSSGLVGEGFGCYGSLAGGGTVSLEGLTDGFGGLWYFRNLLFAFFLLFFKEVTDTFHSFAELVVDHCG